MNFKSDYIYFNAKIRTKLSYLLKEEDFKKLINTSDWNSFVNTLSKYPSYDFIKKIDIKKGTLIAARQSEILIFKSFQKEISKLRKNIPTKNLKTIINTLLKIIEIDALKKVISFIGYKKDINIISRDLFISDISIAELLTSDNIDNLLMKLKKTEYYPVLIKKLDIYKKTKNIFYFNLALDYYYFDLLFELLKLVNPSDKYTLKNIFTLVIEKNNLEILIRFQKYYEMTVKEIIPFLYPKGSLYPYAMLQNKFTIDDYLIKNPMFNVFQDDIGKEQGEKIYLFEKLLEKILYKKIKSLLLHNPFSISIFLAYYFLYSYEIKKLISIVNSKIYNISDRIEGVS